MLKPMQGILLNLCPNCSGNISFSRAFKGFLCSKCSKSILEDICEIKNKKGIKEFCELKSFISNYREFFKNATGFSPYSLQLAWAKRFFLKRSFSILAPTGIGKTTFGIITSLFNKGKTLFILPTTLLVSQVAERFFTYQERAGTNKRIVFVHSKMKKKEKEEAEKRIEEKDFDILLITSAYFYKNAEKVKDNYSFIFVDDVDSFLKASKNIDKLLFIMGFSKPIVDLALKLVKLKLALVNKKDEKIAKRIEKLEEKISFLLSRHKNIPVLAISSATAKPKTSRVMLFYTLLNFSLGSNVSTLRNVVDTFLVTQDKDKDLLSKIKKFKDGILLFLPQDEKEEIERVKAFLAKHGIKALSYLEVDEQALKKFAKKEINVLIGLSSYKNPLARGIDIPTSAKYAIFLGVPRIKINLNLEKPSEKLLLILLSTISRVEKEQLPFISAIVNRERNAVEKAKEYILSYLSREENLHKLNSKASFFIEKQQGNFIISFPDVVGYLQASGRVSRLYVEGLSLGLSVVILGEGEKHLFRALEKRMRFYKEEKPFVPYNHDFLIQKIEEEREKIEKAIRGEIKLRDKIKTTLFLVESPVKVRTISKMFSANPSKRKIGEMFAYEFSLKDRIVLISATLGHFLDLSERQGMDGVIIEKNNLIPIYGTIKYCKEDEKKKAFVDALKCREVIDKKSIVDSLRALSNEVDEIILATDPDVEGEKISFDLFLSLKAFSSSIKRAEFHAITRQEIERALSNLRDIDMNLVKAQMLRRISDRIIGFELSKVAQNSFKNKNYSIGRVQTPVLGWIIERYRQSKKKELKYCTTLFSRTLCFSPLKELVEKREKKLYSIGEIRITGREERPIYPKKPFSTYEMIKESNEKLSFSAAKTMELAQELFEKGFITYHRTDSNSVSSLGIQIAKQYLEENNLLEFFKPSHYGKLRQSTHECIRPTKPLSPQDIKEMKLLKLTDISEEAIKLYSLIFNRFISSQMKRAVVEVAKLSISFPEVSREVKEIEVVERIKEKGFLAFEKAVEEQRVREGKVKALFTLKLIPKAYPFTQGELVEEMKRKGIGRPSTYSTIINILISRGYVVDRHYLYPTKKGIALYNFAVSRFKEFVSEEFTRKLESMMDAVEKDGRYEERFFYIFNELMRALNKSKNF